jgi:hypothetical protein
MMPAPVETSVCVKSNVVIPAGLSVTKAERDASATVAVMDELFIGWMVGRIQIPPKFALVENWERVGV